MSGARRRHADRRLRARRACSTSCSPGAAVRPRRAAGAGVDEIRRIDPRGDPPRPSTRVTAVDRPRPTAARNRDPSRALARQLRGDLDWITMKALEKDRARRYGSVSDLAADLAPPPANEPVRRRPAVRAAIAPASSCGGIAPASPSPPPRSRLLLVFGVAHRGAGGASRRRTRRRRPRPRPCRRASSPS